MSQFQGVEGVLFDEEDSEALIAVERADDIEDLAHDERREAERGFIEQQKARAAHQRAGDGEHLLFAARERAAALFGVDP